jgi:hypothetical protein
MLDFPVKYQTSVFGNLADIEPTPEIISKILPLFSDKRLIPGTFQEIAPPSMGPRLSMSSKDNEWTINFGSGRIDIHKNPTDPRSSNLGTIEKFAEEANELFSRIMKEFNRKANRLALISNYFLKEMPRSKMDDIYRKIFSPIEFYNNNVPFEWNSRHVAKIPLEILGSSENLNVITTMNRVRGKIMQAPLAGGTGVISLINDGNHNLAFKEFERVEVGFDINTSAENPEPRFISDSLKPFYSKAIELRSQILSDLEDLLDG